MRQGENIDYFWMLTAIDTIPDWTIPIQQYRFHIRVSSSVPGPEAFGIYELYKEGNLWNMKEIFSREKAGANAQEGVRYSSP